MRIIIDINHPAQVHFFKNFAKYLLRNGNEVLFIASEKELTYKLLDIYNLPFVRLGSYGNSFISKLYQTPILDLKMLLKIREFKTDFILGFGSIRAAHVSKLLNKYCILFDDDEYSYPYYHKFADLICGFSGFKIQGEKIIHIDSYKELAYLHPTVFQPDLDIFNELNIERNEKFVLIRFVNWKAFHDLGQGGFSIEAKRKLVKTLDDKIKIFISSEGDIPKEFEKYKLKISPEKIHSYLFYANLFISDSQTMTTEAAILGTPAIRCNSFVGVNDMGNFIELENKYGLIFNYRDPDIAIQKAIELINIDNIKQIWYNKKDVLINDKVDVNKFMIDLLNKSYQNILK